MGHTLDTSWSTPENPVPQPGLGNSIQKFHELRNEFLKEKEKERLKNKEDKKERAPSLAELTLPAEELRRLRTVGIALRKKLKIGKAGITEGIVNGIHERWRRTELVKITCEDICRLNMKRTHELLEVITYSPILNCHSFNKLKLHAWVCFYWMNSFETFPRFSYVD